jgi:hypothetical protein
MHSHDDEKGLTCNIKTAVETPSVALLPLLGSLGSLDLFGSTELGKWEKL